MHFIASASRAITKQDVSQLYPSVSPLDVTTGFKKLSEETNKQAATFFFLSDIPLLHLQHVAGPANIFW